MATARRTWQKFEGRVAAFFGVARRVLSGSANRADIDSDDTTHPYLFIEAKLRERHTVLRVWDAAAKLAKKAGKTPVVALGEKNRPGFWLVIHSDDLKMVAAQRLAAVDSDEVFVFETDVRIRRLGLDGEGE